MDKPSFLNALLLNTTLLSMWGAMILHWFFPITHSNINPLTLCKHFIDVLNEKVNHKHYSVKQQKLSGTLAFLLLLFCVSLLLLLFKGFIFSDWLLNLLLLWAALGWKSFFQQSIKLKNYLIQAQKPAARILLSSMVNRETSNLSEINIAKLSCETLIAGYSRTLIYVLFYYFLAGGIGAFLYSLIMLISREWSTRIPRFQYFGKSAGITLFILEWLPARIFALIIAIGSSFHLAWKAFRTQKYQSNTEFLWAITGSKYQIALGGSALYEEQRIERAKLGGVILASTEHLTILTSALIQKSLIWIGIQSIAIYIAFLPL